MVCYCVAYGCKETFKKGSGVSFHSFPADETRKKQWIIALRRENFTPSKYSRLCSRHFTAESFDTEAFGVGAKLKQNAVPSIFNFPPHLMPAEKKRKSPVKRKLTMEPVASTSSDAPQEENVSPPKRSRTYRKSYVGDYTEEMVKSPTKATAFMKAAKDALNKTKKKLKVERKKLQQALRKLKSGKEIINHLKEQMMVTEDVALTLEKFLSPAATELLIRTKDGDTRTAYSPELRNFALTLNFYSARAYDYLREVFSHGLPHPSTLRKWYQSVDGKPGFSSEAKKALILKGEEMAIKGKPLVCALMMDEMCIKKQVEFNGKNFVGYVSWGHDLEEDRELPKAKEALVFMVVALNGHWKIPVGYFLTNGPSGTEKAKLVTECLSFLNDMNVRVVSFTFDGATSNVSMARYLGASFEEDNVVNWFVNPSNGSKVFILLDACHSFKLVRNAFGNKRMFTRNGKVIDWRYLEELEKLQRSEGLHLGTKITKRHINWEKEKMKVKLATQLLSESVACALTYCDKDLNLPQFEGCEETVIFIRILNNIFDILHSRNLHAKGWKKPLTAENIEHVKSYIQEAIQYLLSLQETSSGITLVKCSKKIGFSGLVVCLKSVLAVYALISETPQLKMSFLLTYKMSQDHLEVFFSAVRSHGGHNNNPTARQFEAAFKRLLLHIQIGTTTSANCIAVDSTVILNTRDSTQVNDVSIAVPNNTDVAFINHDHDYIPDPTKLTLYVEDVVQYIAGFVVRRLKKVIKCDSCNAVLDAPVSDSAFLNRKNRGGLSIPSHDVIYLCREGEKALRYFQNKVTRVMDPFDKLLTAVLSHVKGELFENLQEHVMNSPPLQNHIHQLKQAVLLEYFKVRLHHEARLRTKELYSVRVRSFYTKTILFRNQ